MFVLAVFDKFVDTVLHAYYMVNLSNMHAIQNILNVLFSNLLHYKRKKSKEIVDVTLQLCNVDRCNVSLFISF